MENNLTMAKELSAMDLNNIKLDIKHTVLTPEYLENLIQNKESESIEITK
ncbi:MAG: hypothetical protein J1E78_02985 [Muribaculaceae bacterium]|nr:hypothetical protein [Muribaculaceae bacterium]